MNVRSINLSTRSKTVVALTGIGIAAYFIRSPFPSLPNLLPDDVWKLRLIILKSNAYSLLVKIGSFLRFGSQISILRKLNRLRLPHQPSKSDIYSEEYYASGVRVLIYRKVSWLQVESGGVDSSVKLKPCIIYLHGGGWMMSSPDERDDIHRHLIEKLEAIIIAVDYRKAPEYPFPAGFEDCVTVAKHVFKNNLELEIDRSRIVVCGDSAGGNLSAAVALKLRNESFSFIKAQVLIYPSVQFINFRTSSFLLNFPLLSAAECAWCALTYCGEDTSLVESILENEHITDAFYSHPGFNAIQKYESFDAPLSTALADPDSFQRFREKISNPYLCPLMSKTMKKLPETLIVLCDYDVLLDDGLAYADRLKADEVPTTVIRFPCYHGAFRDFRFMTSGKLMMKSVVDFLSVVL